VTAEPAGPVARRVPWPELGVIAAHVALLLRLLRPHVLFGADPVRSTDHALHWYRAHVAGRHFLPEGRLWGYDPFHAAGSVTGTVHDLDNKAVEVFVGVLGPVLGGGAAFNWFLFLTYAAVPVAFLIAARVLRLGRLEGVLAAVLASAAFHGDPYVANWTLFGGFGHVHASVVAPLVVALLARRIEQPDAKSAWWLLATAPLFYVHVLSAVLTAALGIALVPQALRAGVRRLGLTLAVVAAIVLVNLPWIAPMLGDWGRILPTPPETSSGGVPLSGFVRLVGEGRVLGLLLPVVAGAAGVVLTWRAGRRSLAAAWGLGGLLLLVGAFEGNRSELLLSLVEPPRLKVTVPFALALPAAVALVAAARHAVRRWGRVPAAIGCAALVLVGANVLLRPLANRALGMAHLRSALDPGADALFARLRDLGDPRGRLALEEIGPFDGGKPPFRAYLAALAPLHTGRPMIGGPYYRGFTAEKVAAFVNGKLAGRDITALSDREILERLDRYDVTGIAACQPSSIERLREAEGAVVEEVGAVPPYVLFRVRRDAQPTVLGDAAVDVTYDRIDVRPRSAEPIVLKWHFDPRLSVPEPLRLTREPVPDGDPGFVRVEGHDGEPFAITLR
jgi:hypothetical protein